LLQKRRTRRGGKWGIGSENNNKKREKRERADQKDREILCQKRNPSEKIGEKAKKKTRKKKKRKTSSRTGVPYKKKGKHAKGVYPAKNPEPEGESPNRDFFTSREESSKWMGREKCCSVPVYTASTKTQGKRNPGQLP